VRKSTTFLAPLEAAAKEETVGTEIYCTVKVVVHAGRASSSCDTRSAAVELYHHRSTLAGHLPIHNVPAHSLQVFTVPAGAGVELGSLPAVTDALSKRKSDDELLVLVHTYLYK
jgi:hypothetical protein